MNTNRIKIIDLLKGFGIVLMIVAHAGLGGYCVDVYVHSFHMPLFFLISGYLQSFKNLSRFTEFFKKKIVRLIFPYIIWSLFFEMLGLAFKIGTFKSIIWNNLFQIPIAGALWFLTALFFSELLAYPIIKYTNSFLFLICMFICVLLSIFIKIKLPFSIDSSLMGCSFYLFGYLCGKKIDKSKNKTTNSKLFLFYLFIGFVINVVLTYENGYVNMRTNFYNNGIIFFINAIIGTTLWYFVLLYLDINPLNKILTIVHNLFESIGANSIIYLCLNQLLILFFNKVIVFIFGKDVLYKNSIRFIVVILTIFGCLVSNYFIDKLNLSLLKGKLKNIK